MSEEEQAEHFRVAAARRQEIDEQPENKARALRDQQMVDLLSDMIYPSLTLPDAYESDQGSPADRAVRRIKYSMGTRSILLHEDGQRFDLESQKQEQSASRFRFALARIAKTKWALSPRPEPGLLEDIQHRDLLETRITTALNNCHWPYKVGASLYLFQQMHDRHRTSTPSLNKAQWLLFKSAIPAQDAAKVRRGDPRKVGERWKAYYSVSDLWAAYVVWAGAPLQFTESKLIEFYYECELEKFHRTARFFQDFRARVQVPRGRIPYLKRGAAKWSSKESRPIEDSMGIPDLLSELEWAELENYRLY